MMFYVVEGEITVLADRDVEVQRASGVHETVVAEAEIVLTPGDSIMMLGESAATATGLTVTNTGTVNAHVMEWSMYVANPIGPSTPFPEGGEELREDYWYYHHVYTPNITRIDGPVILRLERVLVTAEDNVGALPGAYTLFLPVPGYEEAFKGDFKPDFLSPSEVKSSSLSIAEVYVLTVQPADSGTATSGA
jgi:hypothetical protein